MYLKLVLVACFLAFMQPTYSSSVSFIQKCSLSDKKCLKESAQKAIPIFARGIPELGVKSMDPLVLKTIDSSSTNLKLILNDIVLTGLSECVAKKIQFNDDKTKLVVKLLCSVDAEGLYDIDGSFLVINIVGKGNAHIKLRKVQIRVEADINDVVGADGQIHWKIGQWKHSYELKDKATVELANLFGGNELLGRAAQELIATSPNEIVTELGPPIIKIVCKEIIDNINIFFKRVLKSDLVE